MVVDACVTGTVTAGEVLEVNVESPEYTAVIELVGTVSDVVSSVATPFVIVSVPSEVVPLKNWTVPVGVPAPDVTGATVAVNVTSCP